MAFKQIDKGTKRKGSSEEPRLSISDTGTGFFNRAAVAAIASLKNRKALFVDVLYDEKTKKIGFRFKEKGSPTSYKLGEDTYKTYSKVSLAGLCSSHDLPRGSVWSIDPKQTKDRLYLATLLEGVTISRRPRKKALPTGAPTTETPVSSVPQQQ